MISDVLSDATHRMRWYLQTYPKTYAEQRDGLESLLHAMDHMRKILDTAPSDGADGAADLCDQTTRQAAERDARKVF